MIKWFQDGGFFMYPIAAMFVLGVAIIAERLHKILRVYNVDAAGLMQQVQRLVLENNVDEAVKVCNSRPMASVCRVFKAALVNADRPHDEIQDHVEVATLAVVPELQRRMPYLFTIANVATLMGLLGTIVGLIKTFEAVGAVEGSQKQMLLAAGISTAMNTTALGLIVAIPCMLCYGFLFNRINSIVDEMEHYSARLLILLRTGREYFENFSAGFFVNAKPTTEKTSKTDNAP